MAEESPSQTVATGSESAAAAAAEPPKAAGQEVPTQPGTAEAPHESSTKGMLREAILKVMEEIEYHEREAKKHLQQAEALRNDLRDSFAFLQERGGAGKPAEVPGESRPSPVAEQDTKGKAKAAPPDRQPRGKPRKKPAAGKTREG
jgi:hypothetical protein